MTPAQIQIMVDLLPTAQSLRDISAILGVGTQAVRIAAQPFIAILRMQDALPPCDCGKERFHQYGCSVTAAKQAATSGMAGKSPAQARELLARREEITAAIMTGATFRDIERSLGLGKKSVRWHLRYLTPEQRALRVQMQADRGYDRRRHARDTGTRRRPRPASPSSKIERECRL